MNKKGSKNNLIIKSSKNDFKNRQEYKKNIMMNKLLFNNPDLIRNIKRNNSKTPNKQRVKSPFSSSNNSNLYNINKKNKSKEMTNLKMTKNLQKNKNKSVKNNNVKNNFKEIK